MFYWQVHHAIVAATSGLLAGYSLGWTSTTQNDILEGGLGMSVDENQFSWIGSCLGLGAAAFCVPSGILTNHLGRKLVFLGLTILVLIGWVVMFALKFVWALYLARLLQGAGIGGYCVVAPMYIGEISEKEIRGRFGAAFDLMFTFGILIVFVVGAYTSVTLSYYIAAALTAGYFMLLVFIPESPVYLVKTNRDDDAQKALMKLRATDKNVADEINEIKRSETKNTAESSSLGAAMLRRASIKALIMSLGLMFFQQMCGINAVIFYLTSIFALAKSDLEPDTATIIIGIVQVVATVIAVLVVDTLGRRLLLGISGSTMALSTAALGFYFFMMGSDSESVKSLNWLPLVSLCAFIIMFSLGFGPVPWLMMGELFASDVKGVAAAMSATLNWLLAFVVSKTYVDLKNAIGTGPTFLIYTICSVLSVIFVISFVIETKNKSLNEIQEELDPKYHAKITK